MAIDEKRKKEIIDAIQKKLTEKQKHLVCPACGNQGFILAEGYTQDNLQEKLSGMVIGGPSIPTIIVVCNHCGYVIRFSLGVLGLLPKEENVKKGKDGEEK